MATALIAGVLGAPASAQAQDVPGFERMTARTVQASDEAQTAYETIAAFIEQNPARFGGVRLDGPSSLTVSLPGGTDQAQRVQVLRRLAPGLTVTVEPVSRSRAAILGVKEQIGAMIRAGAHREGIVGVGVDAVRGVVTVYATGDSAAARADLKRRFADTVVFRQMDALQPAESDRNRDTAPHYGGAGYTMWNNAHTASVPYCSLAFPVVRNGVTHGLTAGHCMPGSTGHPDAWATAFTSATPPSIGYYFGTLATTTLAGTLSNTTDGTQDVYGDWALLRGSTYYPRIYNCANVTGSCTHVPIGTASWVTPSLNASLCSSGRTTGQICRQHVADAEYEGYVGNNYTRQLAVFVRDDGGCATIRGGDSGGAIYQGMSSRPGYMRAMGVVTGVSTNGCVAVYTKLSGVRAWDPSITMPTL
ncbi:MAG: hypothetical protein HOV79_21500 [Hamadaea sp.]|nr:hypothetical protein [Hamadaea sp.]